MPAQSLELQSLPNMDRVKRLFRPQQPYEPIQDDAHDDGESTAAGSDVDEVQEQHFSWVEYFIFLLLGVSMLWAWCVW
jgi:solute carrier family 29 (equilibrative nucleoside transporter), member 1/2/3